MNFESTLAHLGINAITGVRVLDLLDISTDDIQIPQNLSKVKDIIDFLKQYPEDTQRFLINKATRGKPVEKLKHFHEYTQLLQKKAELEKELEMIGDEKDIVEATGDVAKLQEVANREVQIKMLSDTMAEEITLYER